MTKTSFLVRRNIASAFEVGGERHLDLRSRITWSMSVADGVSWRSSLADLKSPLYSTMCTNSYIASWSLPSGLASFQC